MPLYGSSAGTFACLNKTPDKNMNTLSFVKANQSDTVPFCALPIGAQFVGPQGGVICTKIAAGKAAFANDHSGKVFVTPENWNRKVIMVTGAQAALMDA